ncbi:MAG: HIT domain-containing protein [Myxococcota bacterium]
MSTLGENGPQGPGECLFCRVGREGPARHRENLVVRETPAGLVMLNRYPYNTGHVMIAPRAHVAALEELEPPAAAALAELLIDALRLVRRAYRPDGVNVGMNLGRVAGAGIPDHCHWHVVPRFFGDTNFMASVGETKVLSESLEATLARLTQTVR